MTVRCPVLQMGGKGASLQSPQTCFFVCFCLGGVELRLLENKNTKEMGHKKSLGDRLEVVITPTQTRYQIVCKLYQSFKVL